MSTAVTMQDLENEHAELLPSRETLCSYYHPSSSFSLTQVAAGQGNTNQVGLLNISLLNGDLSGNSVWL